MPPAGATAASRLLACALLACGAPRGARAVGLHGDDGIPLSIAADSADARAAAEAALRELNVRIRHYCPKQGTFARIEVLSAGRTVVSDAMQIDLTARLDGAHTVRLFLEQGPRGKWPLERSEPYACELRAAAMTINAREGVEKHNADPTRTYTAAVYKQFEGFTDAQLVARLVRTSLAAPAGAVETVAVALPRAALEKGRRSAGKPSSAPPAPTIPASFDVRTALNGVCDPTPYVRDQVRRTHRGEEGRRRGHGDGDADAQGARARGPTVSPPPCALARSARALPRSLSLARSLASTLARSLAGLVRVVLGADQRGDARGPALPRDLGRGLGAPERAAARVV
jgi:hypothetical protein